MVAHRRRSFFGTLALVAGLFVACASSSPPLKDVAPPPLPQLGLGTIYRDDFTASRLEVVESRLTRNQDGRAWAQIDLRNPEDRHVTFSQKFEWLDPDGQVLNSGPNRWKLRSIGRRSQETISKVASDPRAVDFRLQLIQRGSSSGKLHPLEKKTRSKFARLEPSRVRAQPSAHPRAALVIGIENYKRLPSARHARNDAQAFSIYANRALSVPQDRVVQVLDADADNFGIQDAVRRVGSHVTPDTDLYVFFSGHGFSSGQRVPYLIPQDGDARFLDRIASRDELFASVAGLGARSVTIFLDTCYSGRARGGDALHEGMRPLVLASESGRLPEGFTVVSAASATQFSGDLEGADHGLFSYYLMRGLGGKADGDGDGAITVEELHVYVAGEVGRQAARLGREQTPELFGERDRVLVRY